MEVEARLVADCKCALGEGPAWFPEHQTLRFVDIVRGDVHTFDPATGRIATQHLGGNPGFVLPASGGAIIGRNDQLLQVDHEGQVSASKSVAMTAGNRINDATLSPRGELWFGTMDRAEQQSSGSIYRLVAGEPRPTAFSAIVTNGPAFDPTGRFLYVSDSVNRQIWRFLPDEDPDLERGDLFVQLTAEDGYPDGLVTDSEGCLWVGLWDGWGVRRYGREGELLLNVNLPCARVTKIALGGVDLRTAFVTTARTGIAKEALVSQPQAGGLFQFDSPVSGWRAAEWVPLPGSFR